MAYNALNNLIDAYVYANGVQAITGQILNGVLKQMVSELGSGYHLMGVAGPGTVPEQNDYAMAYFAATAGEYTGFGGITIAAGEVAVLLTYGNGSWAKQTIYVVPTGTADLENTANFITNAVTDLVNYYTKDEVDTFLDDYYDKDEMDAALADRYTKSETDTKLGEYYKKTDTYDKDEVDSIIAALNRQSYIVAWDGMSVPVVGFIPYGVEVEYNGNTYTGTLAPTADTLNNIYMVWNGVTYDMYATSQDGGFSWVPMGTTTVDLSTYAKKEQVNELAFEVSPFSFNGTFEQGDYPTTATSIGFGANAGQKLRISCSTTGSLGYGWFVTGKRKDGTEVTLAAYYGPIDYFEVDVERDLVDILLRIANNNTGTVTISIMLKNWRAFVDNSMQRVEGLSVAVNDVSDLSFSGSYEPGEYPTTAVSLGFGASQGQKIYVTVGTTGSLGYGWFMYGITINGEAVLIKERYAPVTSDEIDIQEDYVDIQFRMSGSNSGTVSLYANIENWRSYVDDSIKWLAWMPTSVYDVADLSFSASYGQAEYPTTPVGIGFGAVNGQKIIITTTTDGSLGYGWFITGKRGDGTTATLAERYVPVSNYVVQINEDYYELFFRVSSNNTGNVSVNIHIDNWRSQIDETVSGITDSIENNNPEAMVALAAGRIKPLNYGRPSEDSLLSFLITTDVHSDWTRFARALEFANNPKIDQFICLGDLGDDPDQMRAFDYAEAVSKCTKPCLIIPGNHEVVGEGPLTDQEMMQMFYTPELQAKNGDIHPAGKVYWYKDVSKTFNVGGTNITRNIRIIGMDQYEYCPALGKNTAYHTQEQIDWLVGLLDSADENTYVLILSHGIWGNNATVDIVDCAFSVPNDGYNLGQSQDASNNPDFVPQLVNAWLNGDRFTSSQIMDADDSVISIDHQFANTQRHFICFLAGHTHFDDVVVSKYAGNLMQIICTCTSAAEVQQQSDLSRGLSGKTQDCVTAITYDWYKDKIYLIRFGSDITHEMTERKYIGLSPAE